MNSAMYNTTPRWLSIVLGLASIIFGWLFLTNLGPTLLALSLVLGLYFLVIGIMELIAMVTGAPGSKLWKLISGVLAIIAGVLLLRHPIMGSIAISVTASWLIAFFAILTGIALLIDGFQGGGCLSVILGILGIVLGVLVLFNPLSGVLALPIMMGIMAIIAGITAILGAIFRPSPPPLPPVPVRTPVPPARTDVNRAVAGATAAGAGAVAATKAAADSAATKTAAADTGVDAVSDAASDVAKAATDKASDAAKWVGETMGVEDVDFAEVRLGWSEETLDGLPAGVLTNLKGIGVAKPADFLMKAATPAGRTELSKATGVPERNILRWANQLDLRRVKGIGEAYAVLLEASGVDTVTELAQRNAANLLNRMTAVNTEQGIAITLPTLVEVEDWIRQTKELPRVITY